MNKLLVAALGILALVLFPAMALAKAHGSGQGGGKGHDSSQTPSPSAYEHAGDKAQFQRDTHDMGKHQGGEMRGAQDKDKHKNPGDDQGAANEMDKQKAKEKSKEKGAEQAVGQKSGEKVQEKAKEKELEMERVKEKAKQEKSGADTLQEQVNKSKGEKVK